MRARIVCVCVGIGALLALATVSRADADGPAPSAWEGLSWTDLDGRTWTADDLHGRIVVLDFWATWCAPCLAEIPSLRALHRRHQDEQGDERVVILGVALDAIERRRLVSFLRRHEVEWPQVHAPRGTASAAARRFGVDAVPGTIVVDPAGRIVARDLRGPALDAAVTALIAALLEIQIDAPSSGYTATRSEG